MADLEFAGSWTVHYACPLQPGSCLVREHLSESKQKLIESLPDVNLLACSFPLVQQYGG